MCHSCCRLLCGSTRAGLFEVPARPRRQPSTAAAVEMWGARMPKLRLCSQGPLAIPQDLLKHVERQSIQAPATPRHRWWHRPGQRLMSPMLVWPPHRTGQRPLVRGLDQGRGAEHARMRNRGVDAWRRSGAWARSPPVLFLARREPGRGRRNDGRQSSCGVGSSHR